MQVSVRGDGGVDVVVGQLVLGLLFVSACSWI